MKEILSKSVLLFLIMMLNSFSSFSQVVDEMNKRDLSGCDYLGIWCYVTISEDNRQSNGTFRCTISIPPEGIHTYGNPIGPGSPHFENNLGSTIDLVFSSDLADELRFATDDNPATVEIPVNKWVRNCYYYTVETDNAVRCFYSVVLHSSL